MIHRFAVPTGDVCYRATPTVTVVSGTEDPAYPAANLVDPNPAKPAKLLTDFGAWMLDFGSPVAANAVAPIYHQLDEDLPVRFAGNATPSWGSPSFEIDITIPAKTADNWWVSPWAEFDAEQTFRYWLLDFGSGSPANSLPISVGRLMLISTLYTAFSDHDNDVRWGGSESEEHGIIVLPTELGVETIYELGGKRRLFEEELALGNTSAAEFIALSRNARGRAGAWLLIPDASVNEAWIVRFEDPGWHRTREIIDHNIFPFRVRELSRGLPWPWM